MPPAADYRVSWPYAFRELHRDRAHESVAIRHAARIRPVVRVALMAAHLPEATRAGDALSRWAHFYDPWETLKSADQTFDRFP